MPPTPRHPHDDTLDEAHAERPSKTQLKQQAHELQRLGEALAALPDTLREALVELRRTRSHEGRRRQLQFVGKQMRRADVEPLREAVAQAEIGPATQSLQLHRTERWREELARDDEALTRWCAAHPDSDAQRLRSLVRNARREAALPPEQRHGRAWRELFQFIKPYVHAEDE